MGKKHSIVWVLILWSTLTLFGQKTTVHTETILSDFSLAQELFAKEKYGASQAMFTKVVSQIRDPKNEIRKQSEYYVAVCAAELFNADAEYLLTKFVAEHPQSAQHQQAMFHLGKFYYRENKFKKSLEWLEKTEPDALTENQIDEYYFKLGYSQFRTHKQEQALAAFAKVKDGESKYAPYANYFYAHVQYENGNYESALEHFSRLKNDESFGSIVPFYIAQILYLQKKYDRVIEFTSPVLDEMSSSKRAPELAKLIGESYFNLGKFEESLPYLEQYNATPYGVRTREDDYQLGFAYFKVNRLAEAIPFFEKASGDQDILGQSAAYHLGWCYLQTQQKKYARAAFQVAAKTEFDTLIKEQSLFDYAKLSYELAFDPYDEAIRALQDYINKYPYSERLDEAYTFLANIYMTTKNYRTAIMSLDRIKVKNEKLKTAYQRVSFYRGIELFNDRNYSEAITLFDLSLKYPNNRDFAANANYWKGEAYYRLNKFDDAIKAYQAFVYAPGAFNSANFHRVNYHIGYAYYQKKEYANANIWFKKYIISAPPAEARLIADAQTRVGDAYFVSKDYNNAIEAYDKGVRLKGPDADYCLYQKALAQGVAEMFDAKIASLNMLINNYQSSRYVVDGKFELAKTYQIKGNDSEAFVIFKNIVEQHEKSRMVGPAMVQMGLIYYNQRKDDEALALYKEVVRRFSGTAEAAEAQLGIRRIYVEGGKAMEYAAWVESAGLQGLSRTEIDSSAYEAAEIVYLKGNCDETIRQMGAYLKEFPDGIFLLNAYNYKAECDYKAGNLDAALESYKAIVSKGRSRFTANALLYAANISRKNNPEAAIEFYRELEQNSDNEDQLIAAHVGLMQLYRNAEKQAEAVMYAKKVVRSEKAQDAAKNEARLILAKDVYAIGSLNEAFDAFKTIMNVNNAIGAEARYYMALILHRQSEFARCEKAIFDLVDKFASYDHWVAKAFILLAENYVKLGNIAQAKYTLSSVIDNHEGAELVEEARQALKKITDDEQRQRQKLDLPEENLNMSGSNSDLFNSNNIENNEMQEGGNDE
jgi:TolA-binding protein